MSYKYAAQKPKVFTESGQVTFLKIRDNVHNLLKIAGAFRMKEILRSVCEDSWTMLACVDRLVELGEIRELPDPGCVAQHRVFVSAKQD